MAMAIGCESLAISMGIKQDPTDGATCYVPYFRPYDLGRYSRKHKPYTKALYILLVLNVGNGWVAGGCWDDDITSDDWDHSRKFPS